MDEIAGYRVVRVVRDEGERRVLAAFGDEAVELHVGRGAAAAAMAHEAAVLLSVPHEHLLPVLDVATVDEACVLVRPSSASTVASWLVTRGAPRPGEAVTVAAPVLAAVAALHAAGATAGRIDLHALVLDVDGSPALSCVDARHEKDTVTEAWRSASPSVADDCAALAALVDELLGACGEQMPAAVRAALDAGDAGSAGSALLAAWHAVPIEHARADPAPPRRARERARGIDEATTLVRWAQQALTRLGAVRRPVWIAAAAGGASLVAALLLGGAVAPDASSDARSTAAAPSIAAPPTMPPGPEAAAVDAAAGLLAAREVCLDAADQACLAGLLDPTGGALASTWRLPDDAMLAEVAVLGDAVLVDVASSSEPASVLVVRTDAGWMLRDAWAA